MMNKITPNRNQSRYLVLSLVVGILIFGTVSPAFANSNTAQIPMGLPNGIDVDPSTNLLYATSFADSKVYVIDGNTNTIIDDISVGTNPHQVAFNSATNLVYVTNQVSDTVSVIDVTTNLVIADIPVADGPLGIDVDSNTNMIYVASGAAGTFTVIDGATHLVVYQDNLGSALSDVGVNPNTHKVYVTQSITNGIVHVLNADAPYNRLTTIGVGAFPNPITIDLDSNTVYTGTTAPSNAQVSVIDGDTDTVIIDGSSNPLRIQLNSQFARAITINQDTHRVFVASEELVSVIDVATNTVVDSHPVGKTTYGMTVNPVTNLVYTADNASNVITVIQDTPPLPPLSLIATATGFNNAHGIAIDTAGDVYVSDYVTLDVKKYDNDLSSFTTFLSGINAHPVALAFDDDGNFYMTELTPGKVSKFDSSGTLIDSASGLNLPRGVAVDSAGNVFVAEQNSYPHASGTLSKYTSFPTGKTVIATGLDFAMYIDVDSAGNIFVAETGVNALDPKITKFSTTGTILATASLPVGTNAIGIDVDSAGNVYVSEQVTGDVKKFTNDLSSFDLIVTGVVTGPQDVTVDSAGNVFVADASSGNVFKFGVDSSPPIEPPTGTFCGRDISTFDNVIMGTAGDDRLSGTAGDDLIDGKGGNDSIKGNAGNDCLIGGSGNDRISGGIGDDYIQGDAGADSLAGGAGDDHILGGTGDDRISGGADNDELYGGAGDDSITGRDGNDFLYGDGDADILSGGAGNDTMDGGDGSDAVIGRAGDDTMAGGAGSDICLGGTGVDTADATCEISVE